ncbi:MAG TPA: UDP-glucose/GDP-mannose dehydrogenase family protein [Candidatus Limnocylindria bacterium]|nr:UDP-glucose/GDP-mannose dehydrogenase family protein [Candidatus Limnocylindria bacterium]
MEKTITIIGAGYVGLSTAALLSNCGYQVYLIDINQERLDTIASGKSFFFEEGIDPLIAAGISAGLLIPTADYKTGVSKSSIVFSCVGTPDNPDGSSNLTYVFSAAKEAASYLQPGSVYVQKSTVPVGTGGRVSQEFQKAGTKVAYVSNPEFLREGTAISDTLWFDRIICGGSDEEAVQAVFTIYRSLEECREKIANLTKLKTPDVQLPGSYIATTLESAELIKVTANAFLALKISFANSIAKLSDQVGADITEVMDAVGQDNRIGRAFLNAGRGYGGGCFPKDMSGLIDAMHEHSADPQILTAAQEVNASMPGYIVNKVQTAMGDLHGKKIAVLGLAFKAGTSDARRSQGVRMANILSKSEAVVRVYDPEASHEAAEDLRPNVVVCQDLHAAVKGADAVLVATEWPELIQMDLKRLVKDAAKPCILVDCMNRFSSAQAAEAGLQYIGVGKR